MRSSGHRCSVRSDFFRSLNRFHCDFNFSTVLILFDFIYDRDFFRKFTPKVIFDRNYSINYFSRRKKIISLNREILSVQIIGFSGASNSYHSGQVLEKTVHFRLQDKIKAFSVFVPV